MLDSMKCIPGAVINVAYEEETKELIGVVYFQDTRMQAVFGKLPELLIFDVTYKLNNYKLPLFVLLAVDGNGESEVVALFIIRSESKMRVGAMLDFFKENNGAWTEVEVLVGDKDFADKIVFEEKCPSAKIQICLFHALRTFKREIPLKLDKLNSALKKQVLEIFTDLAYSESEEAYDINYSKLMFLNIQDLTTYYNKNWLCIKKEWVLYEQNRNFIIKNRTTNRLENLNQKMKSVITRYSALGKFCQDLIISVVSTNVEQDHRAITMIEKVPVKTNNFDEVQIEINKNLTQFAASHVCTEYKESKKVTFSTVENDLYTLRKRTAVITATENSCRCGFYSFMGLPCRHIMAYQYYLGKLKDSENLLTSDKLVNVSECFYDENEDIVEQPHNLLLIDAPNEHQIKSSQDSEKTIAQNDDLQQHKQTVNCQSIKLIRPLKKLGNAKGFGQTVIGLKRRQKRKKPQILRGDIFENKTDKEKLYIVLYYFVDSGVAKRATSGKLIEDNEVSIIPQIVPMQRMRDERVNIESIRKFFQPDAFLIIEQLKMQSLAWGGNAVIV
ncbi:hypothetical protein AVEN_96885-1 [Araneus ventricosus]|uniref:SWIM-type domain-containing protein n=1 Tax=Araneus ventricosus TaxID=182803 RepID=A0A4Y2IRF4_ARAVE|nr:hypothetical protein AVEN_96885-1 [Araneus ventricosus]